MSFERGLMLAYEAIDHKCFSMTDYLLKNCGASPDYRPNDRSPLLKEKLKQKIYEEGMRQARREAKMAVQSDVVAPAPTGGLPAEPILKNSKTSVQRV